MGPSSNLCLTYTLRILAADNFLQYFSLLVFWLQIITWGWVNNISLVESCQCSDVYRSKLSEIHSSRISCCLCFLLMISFVDIPQHPQGSSRTQRGDYRQEHQDRLWQIPRHCLIGKQCCDAESPLRWDVFPCLLLFWSSLMLIQSPWS